MAQIFHRSTNTLSRLSIVGGLFFLGALLWGLALVNRSSYVTQQDVAREQPIQFSHKHHAGELGIDCRYCHTAVERSAVAGLPPTETCMNCHRQVWVDSPVLEPVRESHRTDRSIAWIKVHDLPDYVYFHHAIHVAKGVGCASCHGRVDEMNQIWQASTLQMEWCLGCHRDPAPHLRPREQVFDMSWAPPAEAASLARELMDAYQVEPRTDCSACHR